MTDQEMAATLWVNDEGAIRCEPEWVPGVVPWRPAPAGWERVPQSGPIAVGIVRLLRERDEARALVKGMHDELVPGGRPLVWHSWIEAGKKLNEWGL